MIASIHGVISQIEETAIVIEIGPIGLRAFVPLKIKEQAKVGEEIFLFTHMVVREDDWRVYGFENQQDRELFTSLLGVDGVGPRTALSVLSTLEFEAVRTAIINNSADTLSRVPGVGKKTAQKIILHLHDRVRSQAGIEGIAQLPDYDSDVLAALTALGYSVVEAQGAIQSIPKNTPKEIEERLKIALQYFSVE